MTNTKAAPTPEQILETVQAQLAVTAETNKQLAALLESIKAQIAARPPVAHLRPVVKTKPPLDEGIVNYVKERGQSGLAEMAKVFGESRALVHYHAKKLAGAGKISLAYKEDRNKRITLQASDPEEDGARSV